MFVVLVDLLAVPSRYRGVAIGMAAAIKLTPIVFLIVFIVRRDMKSAVRALGSFLTLTVLSWLMWPGLSRVFWAHDVIHTARVGTISYSGNQSWLAVLHRPPFLASSSAALWLLLSAVTLALGTFIAWRCVRTNERALATVSIALAGLLISPISWSHHWVWVMLIPPILVGRRGSAVPRTVQFMLWGVVALTIICPYWWFNSGIASDALDAVLPLWTFVMLIIWSVIELEKMRGSRALVPQRFPS